MNTTHQGIITLLKSAITGQPCALPEGFDLEAIVAMAKRHHMLTLIYAGAINCGISKELPVMKRLFQVYCKAMMISERQMAALQRLYDAFERNGIDYLPLKGSIMKGLYPSPELRMMGDADILIRQEQYEQITQVAQEAGFTYQTQCDHHYAWHADDLHLELHQLLVSKEHAAMHAYFGTGWQFAHVEKGHRYAMSAEDTFIFLFAHFAKHFINAGIGCRQVVDLWVYLRHHPDLDEGYIKRQLGQLGMDSFYLYMRQLLRVWFEQEETNALINCMAEYIMSNGSWGNMGNQLLNMGLQEEKKHAGRIGVRGSIVLKWLYPGKVVLHGEYPLLKQKPVLLPLFVCVRIIKKAFSFSLLRKKVKNLVGIDPKKVNSRREMLSLFGLQDETEE